eukprot:321452-Prymnesium_polylepis.1
MHGRVRGAGGCAHAFCMAVGAARVMLAVLAMCWPYVGRVLCLLYIPATAEELTRFGRGTSTED